MNKIQELEKRIEKIEKRNLRVETDKTWEVSKFRILSITIVTYMIAVLFLYLMGAKNFLLSALVPAIGYFLSIQSLPSIKGWWLKKLLKKHI